MTDSSSSSKEDEDSVIETTNRNLQRHKEDKQKKRLGLGEGLDFSDDEGDDDDDEVQLQQIAPKDTNFEFGTGTTMSEYQAEGSSPQDTSAALNQTRALQNQMAAFRQMQAFQQFPAATAPTQIPTPTQVTVQQRASPVLTATNLLQHPLMTMPSVQTPAVPTGGKPPLPPVEQKKKKARKTKKKTAPTPAPATAPAPAPAAKKPRAKRTVVPLPPELMAFRYEHKHRLTIGEECDDSSKSPTERGPFRVAQTITTGKGDNKKVWQLKDLLSNQLRDLASNIGCTKIGSASKFICRREIALRCDLGEVYQQVNLPSARTTAQEKKTNALIRLINACFIHHDRLKELNDLKKRADFEEGSLANPIKQFWIEISELVNDSDHPTVGIVLDAQESENPIMFEWMEKGVINTADFSQQTHQTCAQHWSDLMKCRQEILRSKRQSGEHEPRTMPYIEGARKHTNPRKGVTMPKEAVYHLDAQCDKCQDIDTTWANVLPDFLASDSSVDPTDSKPPSEIKEEFLGAINSASDAMKQASDKAKEQREEMLAIQRKDFKTALWKQYSELGKMYGDLKDNNGRERMIKNTARRLLEIEAELDIDIEFTVVEHEDIPNENEI